MARGTLDDRYLGWIYGQVADAKIRYNPKLYWTLFAQLHETEFTYFTPNDENRAEDGKELRNEWGLEAQVDLDDEWLELGCSFLELLVGLARRLDFQTEQDVPFWFWKLLDNLGLLKFDDGYMATTEGSCEDVEEIIYCVINRTYDRRGAGGLFPLRRSRKDQTRVELWYQMSEYLLQDM